MEQIIFHIDVNSAFLSWTALSRLEAGDPLDLRTVPSIIGGDLQKRHGVVLAKSVPAKAYGIKTGEPVVNAFRKCPTLISAPPDHSMYRRRSHALMEYLSDICPEIEQVSIDECYMNFTPISYRYTSPLEAARQIREGILANFGFTVNIGISDRKILAKMASDFKKPNLVHTLFSHEIREKLWPLPVSTLHMCGHSSVEILRNLEILTIGDLANTAPEILTLHLKSHGKMLWEYANGWDTARVEYLPSKAKGIGNSTTLHQDVTTRQDAFLVLHSLAEGVAGRLRKSGQRAGMVSCEIKYHTFQHVSHQMTLQMPTDSTEEIYRISCRLFDELWNASPIRLLGIRTSRLAESHQPVQVNLFDYLAAEEEESPETSRKLPGDKLHRLDQALDRIKNKYGEDAVTRGSLLRKNP
ncbi:MAG: DNA polymerase IV [Lachnospiraceae bacterium]|nr:DNA polymerase IV [Lachnospiraceae bacterium]